MPDLREWIEAQLKKGYSASQIKAVLSRRGYPSRAVAEVDKISVIKTSPKINNQKPSYSVVILLIAVILLIVIAIFIYNIYQRVEEQGTVEKTAKQEMSEKGLENAKETEAMKDNELKKFENYICGSLLPENIRSITVKEYTLNYHIDGSKGESIRWTASEQPSAIFSPFEGPKIFSVYYNNAFEGCGYLEELGNTEKISGFKNEVKSQLHLCDGKEIFSTQKNKDEYNELSLYYFKSEEEMIHTTIWAIPKLGNQAAILSNLGCKQ